MGKLVSALYVYHHVASFACMQWENPPPWYDGPWPAAWDVPPRGTALSKAKASALSQAFCTPQPALNPSHMHAL